MNRKKMVLMYQWIKGNVYKLIATLSDTCITLNNSAANHFADVRWCLIGIDSDELKLAIKPVSKTDIDLHLYSMEDLHKISMGNGYARISNKSLMQSVAEEVLGQLLVDIVDGLLRGMEHVGLEEAVVAQFVEDDLVGREVG